MSQHLETEHTTVNRHLDIDIHRKLHSDTQDDAECHTNYFAEVKWRHLTFLQYYYYRKTQPLRTTCSRPLCSKLSLFKTRSTSNPLTKIKTLLNSNPTSLSFTKNFDRSDKPAYFAPGRKDKKHLAKFCIVATLKDRPKNTTKVSTKFHQKTSPCCAKNLVCFWHVSVICNGIALCSTLKIPVKSEI